MKVYFDMDDVLADFSGAVRRKFGLTTKMEQTVQERKEFDDEMFARIREDAHFFRELEPFPETLALLRETVERLGAENVAILTAEPKPERAVVNAAADKRAWVLEHLGADIAVHIVLRKEKAGFVGGKDDILVDDHDGNIEDWKQAGGTGILHVSAEETRAVLVELGVL